MSDLLENHEITNEQDILSRLNKLEDLSEKTYRILRNQMIWRAVYWGVIFLIVISGYIYLGPVIDTMVLELKKLLLVVNS